MHDLDMLALACVAMCAAEAAVAGSQAL